MNVQGIRRFAGVVAFCIVSTSLGLCDDQSAAEVLRSLEKQHKYVSVTLKDDTTVAGQLMSVGDLNCSIKEDRSIRAIDLSNIASVKQINGPNDELKGLLAVVVGALVLLALAYPKD